MYILYKSDIRVMIVELKYHRDSSTFEAKIIKIVSTIIQNEWFIEGNTACLTTKYIITQNESLEELKEHMCIYLL